MLKHRSHLAVAQPEVEAALLPVLRSDLLPSELRISGVAWFSESCGPSAPTQRRTPLGRWAVILGSASEYSQRCSCRPESREGIRPFLFMNLPACWGMDWIQGFTENGSF